MESSILILGILLNVFQFYQIFIFTRFVLYHHYEMKPFLIRYIAISVIELGILSYMVYYVNKKPLSETDETIILCTLGIYLFIKFCLILVQSFVQKKTNQQKSFKVLFFIMKFLKTFLAMNCFMTVVIQSHAITNKTEKYLLMIGVPVTLYLFFISINQSILSLRRKGIIPEFVKYSPPSTKTTKMTQKR